jgi:ankyrin repeat protein
MDKPKFPKKKGIIRLPVQQYSNIALPEMQVNKEVIKKLFQIVEEGDVGKIKEYMLNSNISLSVRNDETGESLLHGVIQSSSLTDEEKYNLCNFLIEHNALVDVPDNHGLRPLHLAAKYQNNKIIDLLLRSHANANSLDSQMMSPLHHAVQGRSAECKYNKLIKKESEIIKPQNSLEKDVILETIRGKIAEYMYHDDYTNNYLSHINRTLANIHGIYEQELKSGKKKLIGDIADILVDTKKLPELKEKSITDKIIESKIGTDNFLTGILKEALENIQIKPNTPNGWGPGDEDINKILSYKKFDVLLREIQTKIIRDKNTSQQEYMSTSSQLSTKIDKLKSDIDNGFENLARIQWCNYALRINYDMQVAGTIGNDYSLHDDKLKEILLNEKDHEINNVEIDIDGATRLTNDYMAHNIANPAIVRATQEKIEEFRNNKKKITSYKLSHDRTPAGIFTDETVNRHTGKFPELYDVPSIDLLDLPYIHTIADADVNPLTNSRGESYYFLSNLKYYMKRIGDHNAIIKRNFEVFENHFSNNVQHHLYHKILTSLSSSILNLILNLCMVDDELLTVNSKIDLLFNDYRYLKGKHSSEKLRHNFLYDNIIASCQYLHDTFTKFSDNIKTTYSVAVALYLQINKFIKTINATSAFNFVKIYNQPGNINEYYDLYDNNVPELEKLPSDLIAFAGQIPELFQVTEIKIAKAKIVESFVPKITNEFNISYIAENTNTNLVKLIKPIVNSKIDLALGITEIPYPEYVPNTSLPKIGYLNDNLAYLSPNITIEHGNVTKDAGKLESADASLAGNIGFSDRVSLEIKSPAMNCVGSLLGFHLKLIKFKIIENIIKNLHDPLIAAATSISPAVPIPVHLVNLVTECIKYKTKLSTIVHLEDYDFSIIYTFVGKTVEEIIHSMIKNLISRASLKSALSVSKETKIGDLPSTILSIIKADDRINIQGPDSGFSFRMNEIYDEIINTYPGRIIDTSALNYTNLLVDEDAKANEHAIYNYSFNTKKNEAECFKINFDTISKLIEGGARINSRDIVGNTPLFYAIELKHLELIELLVLRHGAIVNTKLVRNKLGVTPLKFVFNTYYSHIGILFDEKDPIKKLNDPLYKPIKESFHDKIATLFPDKLDGVKMLRYSQNIIKQFVSMLNHYFFMTMKSYPYGWSFEDNEKLMTLLAPHLQNIPKGDIPIMNYDLSILQIEGIKSNNVYSEKLKLLQKELDEVTTNTTNIGAEIINLYKEKNVLGSDPVSNAFRIAEIDDAIAELGVRLAPNDAKKLALEAKMIKYQEDFQNANKFEEPKLVKRAISPRNSRNIGLLYDSIFKEVVNSNISPFKYQKNTDLTTYQKLWDIYLNDSTKTFNITHIHLVLLKLQKQIIQDFDKDINKDETFESIKLITKLYKSVFGRLALDYEQLPQEYNKESNYVLTNVMNIIIHVVRHTIFVGFYNVIVKLITKYVIDINPKDSSQYNDYEYTLYVSKIVNEIIDYGKAGESELMKYVIDVMPRMLTKSLLKIFESESDPEKLTTNNKAYFETINNILFKSIGAKFSSEKIKNDLDTYIYPYFDILTTQFVEQLKICADGYMRYLINDMKYLEMLTLLSNKAKLEI